MRLFLRQIAVIFIVFGLLTAPVRVQAMNQMTGAAVGAGAGLGVALVGHYVIGRGIPTFDGFGLVATFVWYAAVGGLLGYFFLGQKGGGKGGKNSQLPSNSGSPVDPPVLPVSPSDTGGSSGGSGGSSSAFPAQGINDKTGLQDGGTDGTMGGTATDANSSEGDAAAAAEKSKDLAGKNSAANYTQAKRGLKRGDTFKKTAKAVNDEIQGARTWRDSWQPVIEADLATCDESARFLTTLTDQANQITTDIISGGSLIKIQEEKPAGADAEKPAAGNVEKPAASNDNAVAKTPAAAGEKG